MALLEVGSAAHRLGLSTIRIRQLADAGKLVVAERTETGRRLFHPAEIERFRLERQLLATRRRPKA